MSSLLLVLSLSAALPAATPAQDAQATVVACNQFGLDLYIKVAAQGGNVFFSPYSISKALAMAYAGARGETAVEMASVLHLPDDQDRAHRGFLEMRKLLNHNHGGFFVLHRAQISQAAALWGQAGYGFQRTFLKRLEEFYDAGLNQVDYQAGDKARQSINGWVSKQTASKIPELFKADALDVNTQLVLVTAIYFKGDWISPFKKDSTRPEAFHVSGERQVETPMMSQMETFGYAEVEAAQVLEMPYVGNDLALLVVLPRDVAGLSDLEKGFTAEKLAVWTSGLRTQKVQVSLPRFKMERELDLPDTLKALGMKTAFAPGNADFSGMNNGQEPLWLSAAVHKAFIDVNELGTEAAAATGVAVSGLSAAPRGPVIPVFRADHPFLFAIRDVRTGVILFLGRFSEP